ncbi:MAG: hypothetical protein JRJ39_16260 [Deltaproteobacteria bacterium]|nr:hypothetical protein [Deltaproteobacteria bacterium]MBW1983832.1 hypothetical protein [Deltaproteobacteria bacterium]
MYLFDDIIKELRDLISQKVKKGLVRQLKYTQDLTWPEADSRNIILQSDVGMELGHPQDEAVSFIQWTQTDSLVRNDVISLIGPDLAESVKNRIPFGKIVFVGVEGFDENNCYDRHSEMELTRFNLALNGYMIRAASQYMKEWSRVSIEALKKGFSLSMLGSKQISALKKLDYVTSVEVLFITASSNEVKKFREYGDRAMQRINALRKMTQEMDLDCSSCDYQEVCNEVDDLRSMRSSLHNKIKN